MIKKIFILGVGAQKAGTTYLFSSILKSNSFFRGCPKEMDIFDHSFFDSKQSQIEKIEEQLKDNNFSKKSTLYFKRQKDLIQTPEKYFDFFADKA